MKTRTHTHLTQMKFAAAAGPFKKSLGAVSHALLACSLLSACFQDPSSEGAGSQDRAVIEGRVTGEAGLAKRASAAGWEGASVTVVRLKADGSFETVSEGKVETDAEGRFAVETAVEAAHGLVVVARKGTGELKAVVSGEVKKGAKTLCRPLDGESSLEAEVWAKVHAHGKGGQVSFADVASHVDARVAAQAEQSGDAEARSAVKAFLASQLETGSGIHGSVLVASGKATRAMIEKMDEGRIRAQASLEAALHAAAKTGAGLDADAKAKIESDRVKAEWSAVAGAGIALGEFAKAREAAFRAMIKAEAAAALEGGTRLAWRKSLALQNALSLEAALAEDVKASGGDAGLVAEAGAALRLSIEQAATSGEIDSAFARCRRSVSPGIMAALEGTLGGGIGLSDSSRALSAFELSLKSAATAEAVASAYTRFYADAAAEIKAALGNGIDSARLEAATRAALLVNLQGSVSGPTAGGFTLSGTVEGGSSGAKVELATVKADGSLEILSGTLVETQADGSFSIKTGTPLPDHAVVLVTRDTAQLVALVDARTDSVKVDAETTVETQVYRKVLQEGRLDITPADVKAQVDSGIAASIQGNDSLMVSLLAALDASAEAQTEFLTDSGMGLAQAGLLLITTARANAQGKLEADLKAAAGESVRVRAAYDAYHESLMEAYAKAGLDASAYARSMQVYAQAMAKASVGLSMEARAAVIRSAHSQAARGLRSALEIQMQAAGASEVVLKAAVDAGLALQAAIDASSRLESIAAAYASYHASVTAALRGVFLAHATAIAAVDGRIRSEGGARADLVAAVTAGAGAEAVSRSHVEFAAQVEAEVAAAFQGGLGMPTASQVKVIAEVLLLANMCG